MTGAIDVARSVVRELPDALRPAWNARTFAGEFGARGLHPVVREADTVVTLSAQGLAGTAKVSGDVLAPARGWLDRLRSLGRSEASHGSFRQTMRLHDSGRLEAHHHLLKLDRGWRGSGFATELAEHGRTAYEAAGIDDVTMFAGMSVGGYAWARLGLDVATTAADDAGRTLERGRAITKMVDSAHGLVHWTGRRPQLRTLTDQHMAQLESRLVRGDVLPADALTSVEELASIPDIGRRVLLGREFQGSAELDRTATWWARNGGDAAATPLASWRSDPAAVLEQSRLAAQRVGAQLPAAADPFRAGEVAARQLGSVGAALDDAGEGARAVLRTGLDDGVSTTTTIPMRSAAGRRLELSVAWDGAKLTATERVPLRELRDPALRQALDATWRELGVDRVRSTWTGLRRSIPVAG